jgi:thiamine pyrophosphate-dependent acetolactate synthase large subunit-like protein
MRSIGFIELTHENRDTYVTTEVGQHQMWAAQYLSASRSPIGG